MAQINPMLIVVLLPGLYYLLRTHSFKKAVGASLVTWSGLGFLALGAMILLVCLADMTQDIQMWLPILPVMLGLGLAFGLVYTLGRGLMRGR